MRRIVADKHLTMARMNKVKILIADEETQNARRLAGYIEKHGFQARVTNNGNEAKAIITEWHPRLVLADLMLPNANAMELLNFINTQNNLKMQRTGIIIVSSHNSKFNVQQAVARGAKDYLVKPYVLDDILRRIVFHCRTYRQLQDVARNEYSSIDEASLLLHLTDLMLRQTLTGDALPNILHNLTCMVAMKVDGVRCSLIHVYDQNTGVVVVSNDARGATGIQLDLNKYPEVLNTVNTGVMIAVENIDQSPDLRAIKANLSEINFNSMIVCPVFRGRKPFGVLSVRMPPEKQVISDNEMRFVEIASHIMSMALSNENHKDIDNFWEIARRTSSVLPFSRSSKK